MFYGQNVTSDERNQHDSADPRSFSKAFVEGELITITGHDCGHVSYDYIDGSVSGKRPYGGASAIWDFLKTSLSEAGTDGTYNADHIILLSDLTKRPKVEVDDADATTAKRLSLKADGISDAAISEMKSVKRVVKLELNDWGKLWKAVKADEACVLKDFAGNSDDYAKKTGRTNLNIRQRVASFIGSRQLVYQEDSNGGKQYTKVRSDGATYLGNCPFYTIHGWDDTKLADCLAKAKEATLI